MKPDPLRLRLAGIETPMMRGDNLSIVLASAFENPDQEIDGDTGWTQDAINGALEVLDAIHAHYARALLEAHKAGMMGAAEMIEEGIDKPSATPWRSDGTPSKNDKCPHDFFMYEDCEACCAAAIRAKAEELG